MKRGSKGGARPAHSPPPASLIRSSPSSTRLASTFDRCVQPFTIDDVLRLEGSENDLVRRLRYALNRDTGRFAECPRCHTQVEGSARAPRTECTSCHATFCFMHGMAHDMSESCDAYVRRLAQADAATMRELATTTCPCPSCGRWISKVSGCNHMRCVGCQAEFCYRAWARCGEFGGDEWRREAGEGSDRSWARPELVDNT